MKNEKKAIWIFLLLVGLTTLWLWQFGGRDPEMFDYPEPEWDTDAFGRMDARDNEGLPKSAYAEWEVLAKKAYGQRNDAELLLVICKGIPLIRQVHEDGQVEVIYQLRRWIPKLRFPMRQIAHSILGEAYRNFSRNNVWRQIDQTQVESETSTDLRTWSLAKLAQETIKEYGLSLQPADSLRRVQLDYFDASFRSGYDGRRYRPSMLDLLAWRAIEFYEEANTHLMQSANRFRINDPIVFAPGFEFDAFAFPQADTNSLELKVLQTFQLLGKHHRYERDPAARVIIDLERLKYAAEHAVVENSDSLYFAAVQELYQRHRRSDVSAFVAAELALYYMRLPYSASSPTTRKNRWARKDALDILEEALDRHADSDGGRFCEQLRNELLSKDFGVALEGVQTAGRPSLASLSYKNLDQVWCRIVKVPAAYGQYGKILDQREELRELAHKKPFHAWKLDLPQDGSLQNHRLEFVLPALPLGNYRLLVSSSPEFASLTEAVMVTKFAVSEMAFISRDLADAKVEFVLLDRESGQNLSDVEVKVFGCESDYALGWSEIQLRSVRRTNGEGRVVVADSLESGIHHFQFIRGTDTLTQNADLYPDYRPELDLVSRQSTRFFTDRAIYRPGQTIYFKGIRTQVDGQNERVLAGVTSKVKLTDMWGAEFKSMEFRTNEFGSFSGSFVAPEGQVTGEMRIGDAFGDVSFSVEDYKRPKFEVDFDPVVGSFKLGTAVKVTGKAMAFAGASLSDVPVNYRVVRSATFPWRGFWGWEHSLPSTPDMEIENGTVQTNSDGKFEIEFTAIPDESLEGSWRPKFNYKVIADVVDITGETQSATQNVSVGYQAIDLTVDVEEFVEKEKVTEIKVKATNLNGEPEPTKGKVEIHRLDAPKTLILPRKSSKPDQYIISKGDFQRIFPEAPYADEANTENWKRSEKVFDASFDTEKGDSLTLQNLKQWPQGVYELEASCKDKFGVEVKYVKRFTVFGRNETELPVVQPLWVAPLQLTYEPGDTAILDFGTAYYDGWMLMEVVQEGKLIRSDWLCISNQRQQIKFPIREEHRGDFDVRLLFVKHGRIYTEEKKVNVPWTNKQLTIEFATFRDKLLPGATEEWLVKIKGSKGEKVVAELLAAMFDQSLDAFRTQSWDWERWSVSFETLSSWNEDGFEVVNGNLIQQNWNLNSGFASLNFDELSAFSTNYWSGGSRSSYALGANSRGDFGGGSYRGDKYEDDMDEISLMPAPPPMALEESSPAYAFAVDSMPVSSNVNHAKSAYAMAGPEANGSNSRSNSALSKVKVRSNLNETAFFFPQLRTDAQGNVILKFTMPEALTRWKFRTFAHTKDLKTGDKDAETVTQKELMVQPTVPRFFREGDEISYSAKITNLSEAAMQGVAQLELLDALTMKPINAELSNTAAVQNFNLEKGKSVSLTWKLKIPAGIQAVTHRVKAMAGNFSDGEESTLPVLTNSMLVTEAMSMPVRPLETKIFDFQRLRTVKSPTLRQHKLTLEFTSNPAWYAVQALPYMMEYPYECTEQTFSRFYANALASHIANSHPRIKAVFEQWKNSDKEALVSNLEKNQELKNLLLEETPWVIDAQNESQRKRNVGLLFDLTNMSAELDRAKEKLKKAQLPNGAFTWFPGMPESRYITQHVVAGFGHLNHLGVKSSMEDPEIRKMVSRAIATMDEGIREDHLWILRNVKPTEQHLQHIGWDQVHYLYTRSYFPDIPIPSACQTAVNYYRNQAKRYWLEFNRYNQGMIALTLHRSGDKVTPPAILKSLKEFSFHDDEMGMYWKADGNGMYWYQAPIETQALLIEVFDEVADDQESVEEMKIWLLKQKQTQDWKTTKATAEACYALLLQGTDILSQSKLATITVGGKQLDPLKDPKIKAEAGTGYFKTSWSGEAIQPEMSNVTVKNNNQVVAWGAMYWQYFEQLDKITFAANKAKITKQLYLQQNSANGPVLVAIQPGQKLQPGDLVKVRIIIETDRDMEYVHLKDMRASGFEPINVLSQYKYQNGLGYYETTRDAATNFFFDWLPKGKCVFEYPLRATHKGEFSNGITTLQCMYAPEFTSHSEGVRVRIGG
jgi:uncharacterized protein YfaS (alpha-2-macroglobulin family)